jgi:ATP-dependent exoDNAse (exonuclease V) alpha subunit
MRFYDTKQYSISIMGVMPSLSLDNEYIVDGVLEFSSKYNSYGINVKAIKNEKKLDSGSQKTFLENLTTSRLADNILSAYPNFIQDVINESPIDHNKIHGLGEKRLKEVAEKIINNYIVMDIVELFHGTINVGQIMKIVKTFPTPISAKMAIEENPYVITKVKGIGFKKADSLILKSKPELRVSEYRAKAFLTYTLNEMGDNEGHTWEYSEIIVSLARENIRESLSFVKDIIEKRVEDNKFIIWDNKIGLRSSYNIEKNILRHLDRINEAESVVKPIPIEYMNELIDKVEKEQGFEFTNLQRETILSINDNTNNVLLISGKAGCVDADTEFFTGTEWKRIADYKNDDMVMQFNNDRSASIVKPINYIKNKAETLISIKTHSGNVDQMLSLNHNFVYETNQGNLLKKPLSRILEIHNLAKNGFTGKILNSFNYSGMGIKSLTNDEIRLMVTIIADGRINLKKERLQFLLEKCNIPYDVCNWNPKDKEYKDFIFQAPFKYKSFPNEWYNMDKEQLEIIADEISFWDENSRAKGKRKFRTTIKADADFIQFVFSSLNYTTNISKRERQSYENGQIRKSIKYSVYPSIKKNIATGIHSKNKLNKEKNTKIEEVKTIDGYEYCFEVPSGMLILRRNNRIFITGNSGKSSVVNGIIQVVESFAEIHNTRYSTTQCALSAKASRRMYEVTKRPALTIHKTLGWGFGEGSGFMYGEETPMPDDIIIADEFSMNNINISNSLFRAVKNGARLIIIFDGAQLSSIGSGSVAVDLLESKRYKSFFYDEVHRQAQKSGILSDANIIRLNEYPIKKPMPKIITGELQDMTYFFRKEKEDIHELALKLYTSIAEKYSIEDITLVTPRKDIVINSVETFNKDIQNIINPNGKPIILNDDREFRIGDKVMHRKNNKEKDVINGEVGFIIDIGEKQVENKFERYIRIDYGIDLFLLSKKGIEKRKIIDYTPIEMKEVILNYASTIHSFQGSQNKVVIAVIDSSHYILLDNTLLYTMLTRASEKCALITDEFAFKKSITTNNTIERQTFLPYLLKGEEII